MRSSPAFLLLAVCVACGGPTEPDTVLDLVYDPCEPVQLDATVASDAQLDGVDDALIMWHALGLTGPTRDADDGAPRIEVKFEEAAPQFHGLYDDEHGVIYVNANISDPRQLSITVAHELGHALGLWHVSDRESVMNPGNLEVTPNDGDRMTLETLWGRCGSGNSIVPQIAGQD